MASLRKEKEWFVEIEVGDSRHFYDEKQIVKELRKKILDGQLGKKNRVLIHYKNKFNKWKQKETSLEKLAKKHFKLRVLINRQNLKCFLKKLRLRELQLCKGQITDIQWQNSVQSILNHLDIADSWSLKSAVFIEGGR